MKSLETYLNMGAAGAVKMLEEMPQQTAQPAAAHPYKGQILDIQA